MDALVGKLSSGKHPVAASRYQSAAELRECIDRGFVLVKFTETQGGTELGFSLNTQQSRIADADFAKAAGTVRLVGELSLNYERVRCIADIDLQSLSGEGYLEIVA